MAFHQPETWKNLERHPLSAEYADLSPHEMAELVDRIKTLGFIGSPIVLVEHEGAMKVLDGWQRFQACKVAGVTPLFGPLPEGISEDAYVGAMNDARRHETPEQAEKRKAARVQRECEMRAQGQSYRAIAEQEGVDEKTVRKDLSTADRSAVEPERIIGRDGKSRPATQSASPDATTDALCDRCKRVGVTADCARCEELSKGKTVPKSGKPRYDDKRFMSKFYEPFIREIEKRAEMIGKGELSSEPDSRKKEQEDLRVRISKVVYSANYHDQMLELMSMVLDVLNRWAA